MSSKLNRTLVAMNNVFGRGDISNAKFQAKFLCNKRRGFVLRTIPTSQHGRSPAQVCHFTILAGKTGDKVRFLGHTRKIA